MKLFVQICFLFVVSLNFLNAETEFTKPIPAIDNPRKILFPIASSDLKEVNRIVSTVNNVMKFYRPENTEVIIVVYGQGLKVLLKKGDSHLRKRIEALMTYDVVFIACKNTMRTLKIDKKELLDDVEFATAGIVEIIERKLAGYTYITP
jgi:intracellular sulfur oxidation DsrE/DsrF family protein